MSIYTSTRALPYVYQCVHKVTGEFYIGYRCANRNPSHIDLPLYRTSSKKVKPRFDEFDWQILAEFFTWEAAYWYEQHLIKTSWNNPLLLNMKYQEESKELAWKNYKGSGSTIKACEVARIANTGRKQTPEWIAKRIKPNRPHSEQTKQNMRKPKAEKICPHCDFRGRGGIMLRWHFDNCKHKPT